MEFLSEPDVFTISSLNSFHFILLSQEKRSHFVLLMRDRVQRGQATCFKPNSRYPRVYLISTTAWFHRIFLDNNMASYQVQLCATKGQIMRKKCICIFLRPEEVQSPVRRNLCLCGDRRFMCSLWYLEQLRKATQTYLGCQHQPKGSEQTKPQQCPGSTEQTIFKHGEVQRCNL